MERVATIGFFDGVHNGHQWLISHLAEEAHRRGWRPLIVTFDCHPATVLHPEAAPPLLTTTEERVALLRQCLGMDAEEGVLVLPFTRELSQLTAREFMCLLHDRHSVRALILGYDHRFGHDRLQSLADYQREGCAVGVEVSQAEIRTWSAPTDIGGATPCGMEAAPDAPRTMFFDGCSSSSIRRQLLAGDVEGAQRELGRRYSLRGRVVGGFRIGRQLGYPTANIQPASPLKLIPKDGVYEVRCAEERSGAWRRGMLYIGHRPTFGPGERSIEVHLFDFQGDLYGTVVEIQFGRFIREERTFDSPEALATQLRCDAVACGGSLPGQ